MKRGQLIPKEVLERRRRLRDVKPQDDWHDLLAIWNANWCGRCGAEGKVELSRPCKKPWPQESGG